MRFVWLDDTKETAAYPRAFYLWNTWAEKLEKIVKSKNLGERLTTEYSGDRPESSSEIAVRVYRIKNSAVVLELVSSLERDEYAVRISSPNKNEEEEILGLLRNVAPRRIRLED